MQQKLLILAAAFLVGLLGGCTLVGDIFKAGVWVGVLIVLVIIAVVIYLLARGSNK